MNLHKTVQYYSALRYSLIMAVDSRGGMGLRNSLPWKEAGVGNKTDMLWFREKTASKVIIMGYNTWVSLGRKPLPGRVNIIISSEHHEEVQEDIKAWSRNFLETHPKAYAPDPLVLVVNVPDAAIKKIKDLRDHGLTQGGEVMVIGGARIYEAFMPLASRIYLTTFDGEFEADTFVHLNLDKWDLVYRDATKCLEPKFEIWDGTEEAAKLPDSEFIQISHEHKPAAGWIADAMKKKASV